MSRNVSIVLWATLTLGSLFSIFYRNELKSKEPPPAMYPLIFFETVRTELANRNTALSVSEQKTTEHPHYTLNLKRIRDDQINGKVVNKYIVEFSSKNTKTQEAPALQGFVDLTPNESKGTIISTGTSP